MLRFVKRGACSGNGTDCPALANPVDLVELHGDADSVQAGAQGAFEKIGGLGLAPDRV